MRGHRSHRTITIDEHPVRAVLGGLLALLMLAGLVGGVAASLTMGLLRLAGLLAE